MSKILKKREKMERVVGKGSAVLATTIVGPLPLEGLALVKCPCQWHWQQQQIFFLISKGYALKKAKHCTAYRKYTR